MKTLISQSEFAKLVNANQGTISKYVKKGKLPADGNKLIMPDAEKTYHLLLGGLSITVSQNTSGNLSNFTVNDLNLDGATEQTEKRYTEMIIPVGSYDNYSFEGYTIHCDNVFGSGITVSNNNYRVSIDPINDYTTAVVEVDTGDRYGFTIVPDDNLDDALVELSGLEKLNKAYFIISQSELLELLKSRIQK